MAIWRRLRSEVERKYSTPAMQLLDELLVIATPFGDLDDGSTMER